MAFRGMMVAMLQKLIIKAGVPSEGPRPQREQECAELLVRWQIPGISDERLAEIMKNRDWKPPRRHDHILCEENAEAVEGMVRKDDMDEVKKATRKCRVAKTSASKEEPLDVQPAIAAAGSVSSASSSGAPPVPRPIRSGDHTIGQARAYCPDGGWIGQHTGKAWQVKYPAKPDWPRSHTVTWYEDAPGGISKHDAMLQCLRWVWTVHTKVTGQPCPYQL